MLAAQLAAQIEGQSRGITDEHRVNAHGDKTIEKATLPGSSDMSQFPVVIKWDRVRWPLAVGLVVVGAALVWWVYRLPSEARRDIVGFGGFVLGLVGVLIAVLPRLCSGPRPSDHRSVDTLTTLLAQAVYRLWRDAAEERSLLTPAPIPVRWSLSAPDVAGPVAAAVGPPGAKPVFRPLPGHAASTEADLHAGGGRHELHALYSGLPSGRVVVVGEPGAGKSGAAILLLLDALEHRYQLDEAARARCPVPVLFTTHGWDPTTCSVRDWLADRLASEYPLFSRRSGVTEASALLDTPDTVALILDGLDEMAPELYPAALQALSDAPFRLVVLTRRFELPEAATCQWLVGAATVQLHDVTAPDAANYLHRARTGPPPTGWTDLLTHLREDPDSTLAGGLSTPLALTLVRDTYQTGDDVKKLLTNPQAVEEYLITRVLPAAYTPRAGRPPSRYSLAQARQTLAFLAHRLNQDNARDLAWWHIPRWAPRAPRILATGLVAGLVFGLVAVLIVGLAAGLVAGLMVGLVFGFTIGFAAALAAGLADVLAPEREEVKPQWIRMANWRAVLARQVLAKALTIGLAAGISVGLAVGLREEPAVGLALALALATALGTGLTVALAGRLIDHSPEESSPLDPYQTWRHDRMAGLAAGFTGKLTAKFTGRLAGMFAGGPAGILGAGLAVGAAGLLAVGFAVALAGVLAVSLEFGITTGLVGALTGLLAIGFTGTATWATMSAWCHLRISRKVPAVGLLTFLEDARKRGVLRTVGPFYQFRHATLQDQLAKQALSS
ncbi:MAG: hypothetical protein ACT4NY_08195 [Pseudonocardiales bacterium]